MRDLLIIALLLGTVVFGTNFAYAQSGKGTPPTTGKGNPRPAATPTPQPTPEATTAAIDPGTLDDPDVIKVTTQLVSVPVRVMDRKGRFVGGLTKSDFSVSEDGVKQEIELFSNENEPFTVALMLDMSYSTKFKISEIQAAAVEFIGQLRPNDKVMVISFDGDVHVLCEATVDRKAIIAAIRSTKIATGTSLYEAVDVAINDRMRKIEGRKAVILFTDGVDTTSQRVSDLNNLSDVLELDSIIYPIRYDTYGDVQEMINKPAGAPPPVKIPGSDGGILSTIMGSVATPSSRGTTADDYKKAGEYLDQLAERTGGREYVADSLAHLADAFSKIASELREFYSIGYYPTAERVTGRKATVKVKVAQPGLVVRARDTFLIRKGVKRRA